MIASGSSLRGLSEVTIAMSASSRRDRAHQRALRPVPVAAAAEDAEDAALAERAPSREDGGERLRRVRVVDQHGERLPFVDRLEPARHAREVLDAAAIASSSTPRRRASGDRPEHVLDVEAARAGGCELEAPGRNARAGGRDLEAPRDALGVLGSIAK